MPTDVLVIDVGKTHTRAVLFDAVGRVTGREQATFASIPGPPYRSLPVANLLAFAEQAIARAESASERLTVVPVTHGAAIALIDDHGLVLPVLDYEDDGPEQVRAYDAERPPFEETLSPALPLGLNLGRQMAWLQQAFPDRFARARHFLTLPQFIGWHLTGRAASETTSLGCHSDLWAPLRADFSTLAYARDWRARFPPVRDAGEQIGPLRRDLADRLGIARPVAVLNGLHDSNASLVPHLGRADIFTMISTGTWTIAMAVGGAVDPALPATRDCLANVDVRGRAYPCARFMGGREYAALAGEATPPTLADLPKVAAAVATGRFILPNHVESGGPFPGAVGSTPTMAPDERAALATLYLALMMATDMDLIGAAGPIMIEGPAAANPLFGVLLQALHPGRPVAMAVDSDATARGAALLALGIDGALAPVPADRVAVPGLLDYASRWRAAAEARV